MFAQANLDDLQIVRHVVESLGIDYVSRPVPDTGRAFVDDKALARRIFVIESGQGVDCFGHLEGFSYV